MRFFQATTALSLAYLASAYVDIILPDPPLSSDVIKRDSSDEKTVQIVTVSDNGGGLKYFPENIQAAVGSIVQFQFYPKNHTVTESSFAAPCMPLAKNLTSATRPGQKSGFVPVTNDTQFRPVYNMLINDTKPIWIYCGQVSHCQKGMVMVVNQNMSSTDKTLENFRAAAAQVPIPGASSSSASASATGFATMSSTSSYAFATVAATSTTTMGSGPSLASMSTSSTMSASGGVATFTGAAVVGKGLPVGWGMGLGVLAMFL